MRPILDPIDSHVARIVTEYAQHTHTTGLLLAVSGGLDSLVLLHSLAGQRDQWPFELHVATFDHGWRAESAADTVFVQGIAAQLGLNCTIGRMTVPEITPLGREAAARIARYDFLAQTAREHHADTIVTAHHADDQAETILLHLIRGTGPHGLQGMALSMPLPAHESVRLLRPLLDVSRDDLAAYAQRHGLTPRHDSSNEDSRYQRNALRLEIVPQLKRFNPKFTSNLLRLAALVRDEQSYLDQELRRALLDEAEISPERWMIERQRFLQAHIALQKRFLWQAAQTLSQTPQDVSYERIMAAVTMIREKRTGARIEIPGAVIATLTQTHVIIQRRDAPPLVWLGPLLQAGDIIALVVPGVTPIGSGWMLSVERVDEDVLESRGMMEGSDPARLLVRIPENTPASVQTYASATQQGTKARRNLLETMQTLRIPVEFRSQLPLLMVGDEVTAFYNGTVWRLRGKYAAWNLQYQKETGLLYICMWHNEKEFPTNIYEIDGQML